jgi:DNA-binding transcriptional LysR family regulator
LFAELEALVAVAESGSMERAAHDLRITSSALSRRIQRLEVALGVVVLDRHFKPTKLTQAGFEVLEKSRAILLSLSDLKAPKSGTTPAGPFRLGLSHALARPEISKVILELGKQFPLLQPNICNDITSRLLARLRLSELDGALVVLPMETALPHDLKGVTLSREAMRLVQARTSGRRGSSRSSSEFYRRNWVLNPAGCLVREEIKNRVERLGAPLMIAAELHNPDLQLSLIAGNVGVGMVQAGFLQTHFLRSQLSIIEHPNFNLSIRIAFFRGRYLGTRERAALELQRLLMKHFADAEEAPRGCDSRNFLGD